MVLDGEAVFHFPRPKHDRRHKCEQKWKRVPDDERALSQSASIMPKLLTTRSSVLKAENENGRSSYGRNMA
jgi:hypothetical protein